MAAVPAPQQSAPARVQRQARAADPGWQDVFRRRRERLLAAPAAALALQLLARA